MRKSLLSLHSASAVTTALAVRPSWWTKPIVAPPTEAELQLLAPVKGAYPSLKYKPHPWFRNFGQNRNHIVGAPPKGELFRFKAFWNTMKDKSKELGVKGSLIWFWWIMRRQREAWYLKDYKSTMMGTDEMGNKFWQSTYTNAIQSRWVEYKDNSQFYEEVTVVSPDWYLWIHGVPNPSPHEIRQRHPAAFGKGLTSDYWYRIGWKRLTYDGDRAFYPRGNPHPLNDKYDDFQLRKGRISKRRHFMEFDPFVLPAERLRKRQKWFHHPVNDRRHTVEHTQLPLPH